MLGGTARPLAGRLGSVGLQYALHTKYNAETGQVVSNHLKVFTQLQPLLRLLVLIGIPKAPKKYLDPNFVSEC